MDILSLLPIILMIFALVSKLNKGATRTNQRSRSPYAPSSPWAHNLETSLQKWLSYGSPTPTPEIVEVRKDYRVEEASWMDNTPEAEGTAGIEGTEGTEGTNGVEGTAGSEGTFKPTISYEVVPLQLEERSCLPDRPEINLAEAVIWSEILGKPKARINRPFPRNH
ncbi:hypothetical protein [Desulfosporosinus metallidurans]|uniref:Uncharacterized protein n=1 Tax=Desulfosporosinus metallidurans TaxID=1888891 RepID=A0A1Q8QL66_9FIRM|nr:hypothetical protein [Desulfosporosinus metallidurans]OLN28081.1 hypothetical protein DSOL_4225 [Desulfosporosinus metallidurans]